MHEKFALGVIEVFWGEYLRKLNQTDIDCLLQVAETHDFPGILGGIDCMNSEWKIFLVA